MSGNVCFHFLLLSMNPTHGYGLGLDPIHTEANQKHLFPEINLSLGNELHTHVCGATSAYVRTHTCILCIADHVCAQGEPSDKAALSLWEEKTRCWLASEAT